MVTSAHPALTHPWPQAESGDRQQRGEREVITCTSNPITSSKGWEPILCKLRGGQTLHCRDPNGCRRRENKTDQFTTFFSFLFFFTCEPGVSWKQIKFYSRLQFGGAPGWQRGKPLGHHRSSRGRQDLEFTSQGEKKTGRKKKNDYTHPTAHRVSRLRREAHRNSISHNTANVVVVVVVMPELCYLQTTESTKASRRRNGWREPILTPRWIFNTEVWERGVILHANQIHNAAVVHII